MWQKRGATTRKLVDSTKPNRQKALSTEIPKRQAETYRKKIEECRANRGTLLVQKGHGMREEHKANP